MRVSVCVGNYAKTAYEIPGVGMKVFCMEELCCCMKENAFLLELSLLNDELLNWIEQECGLRELAKALHFLVHKKGSLSGFVTTILRYVGFYGEEVICETERVLKEGAGLSGIEKRKSQIDYLVKNKRYKPALAEYDELLKQWQEQEAQSSIQPPAKGFLAKIWHNRGVACTGLMLYDEAADCFQRACELDEKEEYRGAYLAAMRMLLSEKAYVDFAAEHGELYRHTLELEKRLEQYTGEWEMRPDYLRLYNRRELRNSGDRLRYHEESERMIQVLKDSYRRESV